MDGLLLCAVMLVQAASRATSRRDSREPSVYSLCGDDHDEDDDVQGLSRDLL